VLVPPLVRFVPQRNRNLDITLSNDLNRLYFTRGICAATGEKRRCPGPAVIAAVKERQAMHHNTAWPRDRDSTYEKDDYLWEAI
jgi:hypothetical protein